MRIAVMSTFVHPSRLPIKERSIMQSAVPELIASLCPAHAEIEVYNEKEADLPLDRHFDLVFLSYLHSYYEHTKVVSALLRKNGARTVAGGRHASHQPEDCLEHFDAVVAGEPESNVPECVSDFERGELKPVYRNPPAPFAAFRPYRYDLVDFRTNPYRLPGIEASRGCPFTCNFCVLTGRETYRYRPVKDVIDEIRFKMVFNRRWFGLLDDAFIFLDNNLGGSPAHLKELCEALVPLGKTWGAAVTFNVLRDADLVRRMARAGCRYVYTGLESLSAESLETMNKRHNCLAETRQVLHQARRSGILVSFGLLVGSDGDTGEYLERLPGLLADLGHFAVTFVGIVCPFPGTPFHAQLAAEGRLLPGASSRDHDGYTLCHRPARLAPEEVAEYFPHLCRTVGRLPNLLRHWASCLGTSRLPRYRATVLFSAPEIRSVLSPTRNPARRYIAGLDPIESWDTERMSELGLEPSQVS